MIKKILGCLALTILILYNDANAQDPQFSQFYAAPLYLNPAFAGSTGCGRAGLNYRNQWPSIDASFTTVSAYADYFFDEYNSGLGFIVTQDQEGLAGLKSTTLGLQYAYHIQLTDRIAFRPGFEASYVFEDLDFGKLFFGDQFTGSDFTGTTGETFNSDFKANYFDLAAGGLFFTENFWLGASVHHIAQPNQSLTEGQSTLDRKYSFHAGYKIKLPILALTDDITPRRKERSITPTAQYKAQGNFDQLDLGVHATFEPIVFGINYRGLPVKKFEGFSNNESLVLLLGVKTNGFNIGYSYDLTISDLGTSSGGAHEFTLSYNFCFRDPRKPAKNVMQIPCPSF